MYIANLVGYYSLQLRKFLYNHSLYFSNKNDFNDNNSLKFTMNQNSKLEDG